MEKILSNKWHCEIGSTKQVQTDAGTDILPQGIWCCSDSVVSFTNGTYYYNGSRWDKIVPYYVTCFSLYGEMIAFGIDNQIYIGQLYETLGGIKYVKRCQLKHTPFIHNHIQELLFTPTTLYCIINHTAFYIPFRPNYMLDFPMKIPHLDSSVKWHRIVKFNDTLRFIGVKCSAKSTQLFIATNDSIDSFIIPIVNPKAVKAVVHQSDLVISLDKVVFSFDCGKVLFTPIPNINRTIARKIFAYYGYLKC